jgi:oligoendopeptidase F
MNAFPKPLSAKEMCDMMLAAQDASYGDGLDPNYKHPYMWVCKSHYYSAGLNFYNFPYALVYYMVKDYTNNI